jgi:glycosyltransferase involved in cell wall biosynthesis
MKLLIAADIFPPQSGGPATYVVHLANALVKDGWDVRVVSLNPDGDRSITQNTHHVVSRSKLLRYWQYFWLLCKHAKDVGVIYAMGPVNAGLPALLVAKFLKKKFVVKVVGDYAWEQWQNQRTTNNKQQSAFVSVDDFQDINVGGKIGIFKKVERFVVSRADKVIVPSKYLKGVVEGWGAKDDRIEVIYNAVDFVVGTPKPHDGEKWIVSVARLMPWKGMGALIEIMPDLIKEMPDIRLKIIGDGPEMKNLKFKIKDLGLEEMVELTGELPRQEVLSFNAAANVFVLNSGYEGLSHVLLEALQMGTPVVASNVGGNPELIQSPKQGLLFDYNDKGEMIRTISKVLSGSYGPPSMSQEDQEEVLDFLNQFGFDYMVNHTRRTLESI